MDRKRDRYNAKSRQSIAGGASHKKRRRRSVKGPVGGDAVGAPIEALADPNAEIISLKPLEQKELERRERIRQQVRACSPPSRISSSFEHRTTPHHPPDGDRRRYKLFKEEEEETGEVYCA